MPKSGFKGLLPLLKVSSGAEQVPHVRSPRM